MAGHSDGWPIGWDPENTQVSRGSNNWENNYPLVRSISFGVNLTL